MLLAQAREGLASAWRWRVGAQLEKQPALEIEFEWQRAVKAFQEQAAQINARIRNYNLSAPAEQFHLPPINVQRELNHLVHSPEE
jgi:hypothetical protein